MFRWLHDLSDLIGERLYRAEYRRRMRPYKEDRARTRAILENVERRAADQRAVRTHFDVDEDHCNCPNECHVHNYW